MRLIINASCINFSKFMCTWVSVCGPHLCWWPPFPNLNHHKLVSVHTPEKGTNSDNKTNLVLPLSSDYVPNQQGCQLLSMEEFYGEYIIKINCWPADKGPVQVSIKGYEAVYCLKLLLNYTSAVFPLGLNSNRVVRVLMSLHIGHEKGMICFCRLNFKKVQYALGWSLCICTAQ